MAKRPPTSPRHTGLAILGIGTIPFVAVTSVAWIGDVASSTDPRNVIAGGLAMLGGLAMGLLVHRMVGSVDERARSIARRLVLVSRRLDQQPAAPNAPHRLLLRLGLAPAAVFVPAEVGRRGPPVRVV